MKAKMQVEQVPMVQPATNWQPVILAIIAIIPTLAATYAGWQANSASKAAELAVAQSAKTAISVDGRMEKMLELITKGAGDAATLKEKEAQSAREGATAIEAAKPQGKK
jgi:hypothetical protein